MPSMPIFVHDGCVLVTIMEREICDDYCLYFENWN